jgi:hypothetical protein
MAIPKWRHDEPATRAALFEACRSKALEFDQFFTLWEAKHHEALKVVDAGELAGELWGFESNFSDVLLWETDKAREERIDKRNDPTFDWSIVETRYPKIETDDNLRDFHLFLCFHVERTQRLIERLSERRHRARRDGQPGEQWLSQVFEPLVNYQFGMERLSEEIGYRLSFILIHAESIKERNQQIEPQAAEWRKIEAVISTEYLPHLPAFGTRFWAARYKVSQTHIRNKMAQWAPDNAPQNKVKQGAKWIIYDFEFATRFDQWLRNDMMLNGRSSRRHKKS